MENIEVQNESPQSFSGAHAELDCRMVVPITLADLSSLEISALQEALSQRYTGETMLDLIDNVCSGHWNLMAYRGMQNITAVVACQFITHRTGKELNVLLVGGENFVRNYKGLFMGLADIARRCGCRWVSGGTPHKSMAKVFRSVKPEIEYYEFMKEVSGDW